MTSAKILVSIEDVLNYLDVVGISYTCTVKRKNLKPGKYSEAYFQACHTGDYKAKFLTALHNSDYDIILEDGSFFNSHQNPRKISIILFFIGLNKRFLIVSLKKNI